MRIFWKTLFSLSQSTILRVPAIRYVFWKIMNFHVFSRCCFLKVLELTFFDFGRFWNLQNRPWPLQSDALASTRARFSKKHDFFMKKRCSKKTWFFFVFGPSKITQNLKKNDFLAPPKPDFFILLSSRDPSDPPLAPSELKNPEKSPKNNTKQLKTPRNHQRCKLKKGHLQLRFWRRQRCKLKKGHLQPRPKNFIYLSNVSKPKQTNLPEGSAAEAQACKFAVGKS